MSLETPATAEPFELAETAATAAPPPGTTIGRLSFLAAAVFLLAYSGVILSAFGVQFIGQELPCPLCMLQRTAMMLICVGPMWLIALAKRGELTVAAYASAYGLSILGALFGGAVATRQILLHIAPVPAGEPTGYGSAVLGFHLYTWALVTFFVVIVFCAIMMLFAQATLPVVAQSGFMRSFATFTQWFFILIVIANIIMVICLVGDAPLIPDDPTGYALFDR